MMPPPKPGPDASLDPALVLAAYRQGFFPMGNDHTPNSIEWYTAKRRGIIPLHAFHIPRRLQKTMRSQKFTVTCNQAFAAVIAGCAAPRQISQQSAQPDHGTWINQPIIAAYTALHEQGFAHSIEVWHKHELAGGLYGVALGRAFFAESMFSRARDASKVALAHLLLHLRQHGYTLCDTQFLTPHLAQFGAIEISASAYLKQLQAALEPPLAAAAF